MSKVKVGTVKVVSKGNQYVASVNCGCSVKGRAVGYRNFENSGFDKASAIQGLKAQVATALSEAKVRLVLARMEFSDLKKALQNIKAKQK